MQKLKASTIQQVQHHNQREMEREGNPYIDKEKSILNYDLLNQRKIDYLEVVENRIEKAMFSKKKIRKDAVRLCEFLITSEKEFFANLSEKEIKRFFNKGLEFFQKRYEADHFIYACVHYDEKIPHMHIGFVPITEDYRLNANELFSRLNLVMLQDDFLNDLNEAGFELKRSVSGNREDLVKGVFSM